MIYSVGEKPATQPGDGSRTLSELLADDPYPSAKLPSRRLPAIEAARPQVEARAIETQTLTDTRAEQLAASIMQRIHARLPCRIRRLRVFVTENTVILEGQCSTYYTKQIAQHTAMGVLEYERLTNHIEVCTTK